MITEKTEYDVTMKSSGHLEVRRSDVVFKDGIEIARTYHRHVVAPGDDVSEEVQLVKDLAALWTPELIEAAKNEGEANV